MLTWGGGGVPARTARAGTPHRALVGIGLALLLVAGGTLPAAAARRADPGGECPPDQHDCSVWDDEPGTPGGPDGGGDNGGGDSGGGDSGGGGGGGVCQWGGRTIPCYDDLFGWFNNGDGCYYKLTEGPVEPPEGQQWYLQTCNGGDVGAQDTVTLDEPPPGFGAPPDPEELARRALARITISPPRIAVAPRRSTGPGLVGLPVWMWASEGRQYFGPVISESETERDVTVTVDATFDRIVWDMGNDEQVTTCTGPGTKYTVTGPRAGLSSPDCGYDKGYPKAGTYRVGATTYWTVTWRGGGESGVIPQTRTSGTVPIQINELQVVTR
ncbi:hypothetical protein [Micromonospora sp. U21]|uniref:hypothetical protein n=1 Tax=Micromonospora sp. U21 TaxID=2824899 RepID=UPI001B36BD2A|nr:hypothetical protein [Micromonospora sp. U21]MBQ0905757.1 hypothetical protein [Micromonospora sp. U21]